MEWLLMVTAHARRQEEVLHQFNETYSVTGRFTESVSALVGISSRTYWHGLWREMDCQHLQQCLDLQALLLTAAGLHGPAASPLLRALPTTKPTIPTAQAK